MKKATLIALCLTVGFAFSAWSHVPEDQVLLAFQFPAGAEPTLDGDLSEWAVVPEDYWIGPEYYTSTTGEKWTDLSSLNSKIIVGYSASQDRLYMHYELFDNFRKRDVSGIESSPPPLPDTIELSVDGDHGGERSWADEPEDRGRFAQNIHFRLPNIDPASVSNEETAWYWFWHSQATWAGNPPYADQGYTSDSVVLNAADVTSYAEWMMTLWDNLQWDDPDGSVVHDFVEGEIIGLNWMIGDYDNMDNNEAVQYVLNGEGTYWETAAVATDFLLAPLEDVDFGTAVEAESWGRIKAAFEQ